MSTPRIQISHAPGEIYPNVAGDFDWIHAHRKQLLETYGECVVLVYHQNVIGKGETLQAGVDDAERCLPADVEQVTPVIEYLAHRQPFFRVRPSHS